MTSSVFAPAFDVERVRRRFPALAHKTYLNSGSHGLLSIDVRRAFEQYLGSRDERGSDWSEWLGRCEAVRQRMARLLNAAPDEIAVTASASAGINALASALRPSGKRRKIVVSDFEFPTSAQIWHAQAPRGFLIEHVPEDASGYIPVEHFERVIDESTALVAIAQVCYRNGAMLDVARIARLAHERGALLLLDCYQVVGAGSVDVRALGVDFAVGGMMKYLLGTSGIGFLYARAELGPTLTPTISGWFAQADLDAMDIYHNVPAPTARRFQAGTPPVPNCYAAAAGLDVILALGVGSIESHVRALTAHCMDRLAEAGCSLATPRDDGRRGPQVAIRSTDDSALVARLAERGIVTSCRAGNVRATFHCYNNEEDVDALVIGLLANRDLL
ncbi:MAG: aminotransferase class V-fold PLP-dependent enzyme [Gammaproteobacteria bacterium]